MTLLCSTVTKKSHRFNDFIESVETEKLFEVRRFNQKMYSLGNVLCSATGRTTLRYKFLLILNDSE